MQPTHLRQRGSSSQPSVSSDQHQRSYTKADSQRAHSAAWQPSFFAWLLLFIFRVFVNPFLVQTSFSPDEYYQALEVAHCHVFRAPCGAASSSSSHAGHDLTWEWTIDKPIRGYLHPIPFILVYKLLSLPVWGGILDQYPALLVYVPKMMQGVLQFLCDVFLYKLALLLWSKNYQDKNNSEQSNADAKSVASWTLFSQVINWFTFFCGVRTFANSSEATISIIGLYYYYVSILSSDSGSSSVWRQWWRWLFFAGLGVVVRQTKLIFWIPIVIHALWNQCIVRVWKSDASLASNLSSVLRAKIWSLVVGVAPMIGLWIGLSVALDSWYYGKPVFAMWNFMLFNVIENRSHMYGVQPWHWYVSQGLPVMIISLLPIFLVSLWTVISDRRQRKQVPMLPLVLVAFTTLVYSLLAHKEFRFLFHVLPLVLLYCGHGFSILSSKKSKWLIPLVVLVVVSNILAAGYFGLVHQRAPIQVMHYLREKTSATRHSDIHFLMPCHHVPAYSHIHSRNVTLRMLDCSPDFSGNPHHVDEADRFFSDPQSFISKEYVDSEPEFVVMYEQLADDPAVARFLRERRYKLDAKFFHCHVPHVLDRRMSQYLVVYRKNNAL